MAVARSTDPITSRIAKKSDCLEALILGALRSTGPMTSWELVKTLNAQRDSYHHDPDNPPHEITIDSVSPCLRPMCREGLVHEAGMKENTVRGTGNQVVIWAAGPSADWRPGHSMPPVRRGGSKPKIDIDYFTPAVLRAQLGKTFSVEELTTWLNQQLEERFHVL
jgi:hypothetical protein